MYLLHTTSATGVVQTVSCESAFLRGLLVISLAAQPLDLRLEDRPEVPTIVDVALVPTSPALGPIVDVALVPRNGGAR